MTLNFKPKFLKLALALLISSSIVTPTFAQKATFQKNSGNDVNALSDTFEQAKSVEGQNSEPRVFSDSKTKFKAKLPAGWSATPITDNLPKELITRILFEGAGAPSPKCIVSAGTSGDSKKVTQKVINSAIHKNEQIRRITKGIAQDNQKVVASKKITQDKVAGLFFDIEIKAPGITPNGFTFLHIFETPGVRWQIACSGAAHEKDELKKQFDEFITGISF